MKCFVNTCNKDGGRICIVSVLWVRLFDSLHWEHDGSQRLSCRWSEYSHVGCNVEEDGTSQLMMSVLEIICNPESLVQD